MSLSTHDERELLLPLLDGIFEQPLWDTFLRRLLVRTRSSQVCLLLRTQQMGGLPRIMRVASANPDQPEPDWDALGTLGLAPYSALRPLRVYALEEMLNPSSPADMARQRQSLATAGIGHARFIHIETRRDHHAWLILIHERVDFSAADGALLSALAQPLASTLLALAALDGLRLRAAMAEQALERLSIHQVALDKEGRSLFADDSATLPRRSPELAEACTKLDAGAARNSILVRVGEESRDLLLLRPPPQSATTLPTTAVAIGAARRPARANPTGAASLLERELGLSPREAALAEALSRGQSLMEAGKALRLTPETTRNYSKRIYAKTGASGQADLVRMILTGLAPLA